MTLAVSQLLQHDTSCLCKPQKSNRLLQNSLTNASGENWRRQRPLVAKAFSNPSARILAAKKARELILELPGVHNVLDARVLGLHVAIGAVAVAVVSEDHSSSGQACLQKLYLPNLLLDQSNVNQLKELQITIKSIVSTMSIEVRDSRTCLAKSLLEHESPGSAGLT
jgi:hypothetical protein